MQGHPRPKSFYYEKKFDRSVVTVAHRNGNRSAAMVGVFGANNSVYALEEAEISAAGAAELPEESVVRSCPWAFQ